MLGTMLTDVILQSTSLRLQEGQRVHLTPTTNLPDKSNYFARPADGKWSDGLDRDEADSILITPEDVRLE